jgi:thiol-disulfide isomerase/thioredoxin
MMTLLLVTFSAAHVLLHPPRCLPAARRATAVSSTPKMVMDVDGTTWCPKVTNAERMAIVFFYAPWCRNCKAIKPVFQRLEHKYPQVSFFQADFKTNSALCYQERVFAFPTAHVYLPGVGRVARCVLSARDADSKLRATLERFLDDQQAVLLQAITAGALQPLVRYKELAGALTALADYQANHEATAAKTSTREGSGGELRAMVEGDEQRLAQLEELFR